MDDFERGYFCENEKKELGFRPLKPLSGSWI